MKPAEHNAANLALARRSLRDSDDTCRMISWPEQVAGVRALPPPEGKRDRVQRDYAIARWQGREFLVLRQSATTCLARALVEAGCPDMPWQMFTLDGTPSLRGKSLHAWSRRVVTEGRRGLQVEDYQPHPGRGSSTSVGRE